jgi:DNA end-binding protein Ku
MPRAIWSGAISFGLVNVPVKLYSAVSKKTVRFHQLHDRDGVRIQQKRICPEDGEEVSYENIVKGYEIGPGQHVVVTQEELEGLDPKKTRTIDIEDFVELEDIDPIYYDHPYYLVPDKGADKAYNLLREAMRDSGRVAIARVVIRQKEHLTAIRPAGDVMTMATMLFGDEVVSPEGIDELPDETETTNRELDMARQLIDSLATDFDPGKYRDEYRERVLDLIERKAEGEEIAIQPEEEPERVPDLMAALEASVKAAREGDGAGVPADGAAASGNGRSRSSKGKAKASSSKGGGGRSSGGGRSKKTAKSS